MQGNRPIHTEGNSLSKLLSVREIKERDVRSTLMETAKALELNGLTDCAVNEAIQQIRVLARKGMVKVTCTEPNCAPWLRLLVHSHIATFVRGSGNVPSHITFNPAYDVTTGQLDATLV